MTETQRDVWWLAREIMEREAKAIDPANLGQSRSTRQTGGNSDRDWAISYFSCIPPGRFEVVRQAHECQQTQTQARKSGAAVRWFYRHLQQRRLYGQGLRIMERR